MKIIATALLASAFLAGADADFNGRWNIEVTGQSPRVKWLDVQGAGTASLAGTFVGFPGGQVDKIPQIKLENGVLEFSFERRDAGAGGQQSVRHVYRGQIAGSELRGNFVAIVDGKESAPSGFCGKRAPVITDKDDGSWKPARTVELFDGKSTAGWRQTVPSRPGWVVEKGFLRNLEKASDIISDAKFWNFELTAEYRYGKGSNSGIGLRGRYEVQIYDDYGQPASLHGHGALYSRIAPAKVASRAPGEWQTMHVRLIGRDLTVTLNGEKVIEKRDAYGATAMSIDAQEDQPGPIGLQGDHGPVEFRRISVTELVKK